MRIFLQETLYRYIINYNKNLYYIEIYTTNLENNNMKIQ